MGLASPSIGSNGVEGADTHLHAGLRGLHAAPLGERPGIEGRSTYELSTVGKRTALSSRHEPLTIEVTRQT